MRHIIILNMEDNGENSKLALINYRLESIENTLGELKALLVDVPRLQDRITLCEKQTDENKLDIEHLQNEVQEVSQRPAKKDAARWQYILDFVFKTLVAAAVVLLLAKIGVKS